MSSLTWRSTALCCGERCKSKYCKCSNVRKTMLHVFMGQFSYLLHIAPPWQEPDHTFQLCTPVLHPLPLRQPLYATGWKKQNDNNIKIIVLIQSATWGDSRARIGSLLEHTMIILMHSSTDGALWHSIWAPLSPTLLTFQKSHFAVSAFPTAHHLMEVDVVDEACSGRQRKQGTQSANFGFWLFN